MQKIEKTKLNNGLEIYFLFDKKFTTSSIQMMFKTGWRNDPVEQLGLAHLFEHLVGKRTQKYPGKSEFAKKLETTGISHNAWTGPDSTVYLQEQTNENLLKSLELFYEAIYHSTFEKDDLEKEKQVVLTESRRYLDNDSSVVWLQMIQNLFPNSSMGKFFFGNEKTLANIRTEVFEDFYTFYKNPKNVILFIGTDDKKKKKKIISQLESFYKKYKAPEVITSHLIKQEKDVKKDVVKFTKIDKKDKSQSEVRVGFRFDNKLNKKERVAFGVLKRILTGGLTGKMMQILRDEMGLIYGVDMWWDEHHQNVQYVEIETECAKDKSEIVVNKIVNILQNIENHISDSDIKNVIPICVYQSKKPVSASRDLSELVSAINYNYEYIQTEESLRILKSLKSKDLVNLSKKIFMKNNKSVVVMK